MLVFTRRIGETMVIGDDAFITVLGVKGNQIRLGIDAPKSIPVHREEIYQKIKKEQKTGPFMKIPNYVPCDTLSLTIN